MALAPHVRVAWHPTSGSGHGCVWQKLQLLTQISIKYLVAKEHMGIAVVNLIPHDISCGKKDICRPSVHHPGILCAWPRLLRKRRQNPVVPRIGWHGLAFIRQGSCNLRNECRIARIYKECSRSFYTCHVMSTDVWGFYCAMWFSVSVGGIWPNWMVFHIVRHLVGMLSMMAFMVLFSFRRSCRQLAAVMGSGLKTIWVYRGHERHQVREPSEQSSMKLPGSMLSLDVLTKAVRQRLYPKLVAIVGALMIDL